MAGGAIYHRDIETTAMIRGSQMMHMFPVSVSVPSVSPWWETIMRNKANRGIADCRLRIEEWHDGFAKQSQLEEVGSFR